MAKAKHLYFAAAAPDGTASTEQVVMFPVSQVSHYEMASATSLRVYFESAQEKDEDSGIDAAHVVLTIASGKYKDALNDIAKEIANAYGDALITVADEVNSKYVSSHITACASIAIVDAS
jgi:hypothetical protein